MSEATATPEAPTKEPTTNDEPKGESKGLKVPDSMTSGGRAKSAKKGNGKTSKPKASKSKKAAAKTTPKGESTTDSLTKEQRTEAENELKALNKTQKEKGYTQREAKRARELCALLDKSVPKWAQTKGSESDKPKRADDPDMQIAHRMTAFVFKGSVKDGKVVKDPDTKFGADYNTTQVRMIRDAFKGKDILKTLGGISNAALKRYAQGDEKLEDADVKKAFREFSKQFDPKAKIWARKVAGAAYVLNEERKSKGSKSTAKK